MLFTHFKFNLWYVYIYIACRYGEEGLKEGGGVHFTDGFSLFETLFGGGLGGRDRGPKKADDITHHLKLSLEDLYAGKT